jgi:membrane associated rhomboid family serine protease
MNQYSNPLEELKLFFKRKSILSTLIMINAGIWIFTKVLAVVFFLFNQPDSATSANWILNSFALPSSIDLLSGKPWTLLTYMFLHLDFFHILFNMLWLYWFGKIFLEYLTSRQLLKTYLIGGLAGGLLFIMAFNLFPVFRPQLFSSLALGASASVMAIVMTISFFVPNYTIQLLFVGRVKIIYLALILFIFDFFAIPAGNSGGHFAHIGGALWGFIYVLLLRKGNLPFMPGPSFGWSKKITSFFSHQQKKKAKDTTYYSRPKTDDEYNAEKLEKQKKTDAILEKISKGGYDSLSKEEKAFLFKSSGKNN